MHAPPASSRIEILKEFNRAGVPTYAFVGPLFPHFRFVPEQLDHLFAQIASVGTREVYVEQINVSSYIRKRLDSIMQEATPELAAAYAMADEDEHRRVLQDMAQSMIARHGLKLRLSKVLDHRKNAKRESVGTATV